MKKIFNILVAALVLTGVSCTDDLEYKPGGVTPVTTLLLPADNYYVELQSASTAVLRFAWEPAQAADGQLPHYEVVFFNKPGGEIVYRYDAGSSTSIAIAHKEINRIASAAGIDVGADGAVYWSVVSCRGIETAPVAAAPRQLELTRLLGFNVIPEQLFLTGDATEAGDELASACVGRKTGDGEFTFYQRLEAGKGFTFVSSKGDDRATYTVVNGVLNDQSAEPATIDRTGVYRIKLDMNVRGITFEYIDRVEFNFAPRTSDNGNMEYIGNGCWKFSDYKVEFREEGWGLDQRYNFHPVFDGVMYVWAGAKGNDSSPSELSGSGYYILTENLFTGDAYGPEKFKFHSDFNGKIVDITLIMSGDVEHCTHVIEIVG